MFLLSLVIFLAVQVSLMALCFAPLGLAFFFGWDAVINWYAERLGNLTASLRSNWWALIITIGLIVLNLQALIVYDFRPIVSPIVIGAREVGVSVNAEREQLTDGHVAERLATLFNGGQPMDKPDFGQTTTAEPKSSGAAWIWLWAALLSWPSYLVLMLFVFSDDIWATMAMGWAMIFHKKTSTEDGESTAGRSGGDTSSGSHHNRGLMSWLKWFLALFGVEVGADLAVKSIFEAIKASRRA